jgi:uncharacterized membrane protein YdjX (TVP38/TMEM64 family)
MRASLPYVAAAALLLVAVLVLGHEIKHHVEAIESWVEALGPWGVVAFVALFVVGTSLLLPESVFGIAAGALFGLTSGFFVVVAANLLAAALQYALSRRLLQTRIERMLVARPALTRIRRAVLGDELRLQFLLRLAPLNPTTVSYLLGAAGVGLRGFLLACLGQAPHLLMEVYFGHAGRHVARLVGGAHGARLHDLALLGGLAAGILGLAVVSRAAHRAVLRAVAATETPPGSNKLAAGSGAT